MESRWAARLRKTGVRLAAVLVPALFPFGAAIAQIPPFEEAKTLSSAADPIERDFDIGQSGAGKYKITLSDLGATLTSPGPAPLDSVEVIITRGTTVVAVLEGKDEQGDPPSPVDTMEFDATPGTYTVHVVGVPGPDPGSGPVGVKIESVATPTATVLDLSGTLAPAAQMQSGVSTYQLVLDVPATGDYEMTLTDLAFPTTGTLGTVSAYVFPTGGSSLTACLNLTVQGPCGPIQTATLTAGQKYQLVVGGSLAAGMDGGLFSVNIKSVATGAVLHSRTLELGAVKRISDTSFQLDAGPYTLSRNDLEFPFPLTDASAIVTRAGQLVALADSVTPDAAFTVAADDTPHDVFAYAKADTVAPATGAGTFDVELTPASGPAALSYITAMGDPSGSPVAYAFPINITTGGKYTAKFGDFQFPAALGAARLAVVQNGAIVSKTDPGISSSLTLDATLAVGTATVVVIVKPVATSGSLSQTGGTFGLEMALAGASQNVLDVTQGVGGVVSVRKVSITTAGRYDLKVADLKAPEVFNDLMVVISRGSQKIGTAVVGSGGSNEEGGSATLTDLDLSVGNYAITLVAQPGTDLQASTYSLSMNAAAPAPTVTLTATPTSVASGTVVGLTWTSQGATSCAASSNPSGLWSGTKSAAGTDSSSPVTAETTFTLRCTDANNRTTEKSVTVQITAQNNNGGGGGGGGGAFDWLTLAALALATGLHLGRRRAGGAAAQMTDL